MKNFIHFCTTSARAIIGDMSLRRKALAAMVVTAAALLFLGVSLLAPVIEKNILLFAFYWLVCTTLTFGILLLALLDLLLVIAAGRRARRDLEERLREIQKPSTKPDSSNTSAHP